MSATDKTTDKAAKAKAKKLEASRKTRMASAVEASGIDESLNASQIEATPTKLPETQATITKMFRNEKAEIGVFEQTVEQHSDSGKRSTEAILKSLESKMNRLVTTEHLQEQFKKMITEEMLSSKLEKLKKELKDHFDKELDKVYIKIHQLEKERDDTKSEVEKAQNDISGMQISLENLQTKTSRIEEDNKKLKETVNSMNERLQKQDSYLNDLEQYTRRNNIRILGLNDKNKNEPAQETTYTVLNFLREKLGITMKPGDIDIAHRIGRFQSNGNRIVICRFVSRSQRNEVMKKRSMLKGTQFIIKEDLTWRNAKLLEKTSELENVQSVWSDQGKIIALLKNRIPGKKETMVVTLSTDLSKPLVIPKKPMASLVTNRD